MTRAEGKKRKEGHRDGKIVTAFTHADDDRWLPPCFVVGALAVRHGPGFDSYEVGGAFVDGATIKPILNPTPELIKQLKEKGREWKRQDARLAARRGREDGRFRERRINKDFEVHLVREDQQEAFGAFCDEMRKEDRRLCAERRAEVAKLVKDFRKKGR